MMAAGNMSWHLSTSSELLRTSYLHFDPHLSRPTSGERDFSTNFTTTIPDDAFFPPADVSCDYAPGTFGPSDDCRPACGENAICCADPATAASACFGVDRCETLPGAGFAAAARFGDRRS